MKRYIDVDALKHRLELVSVDASTSYELGINTGLHRAEEEVEMLPTADVAEVRHGEWEEYLDGHELMCSCCKTTFWNEDCNGGTNYCPDCGAKMDGGNKE